MIDLTTFDDNSWINHLRQLFTQDPLEATTTTLNHLLRLLNPVSTPLTYAWITEHILPLCTTSFHYLPDGLLHQTTISTPHHSTHRPLDTYAQSQPMTYIEGTPITSRCSGITPAVAHHTQTIEINPNQAHIHDSSEIHLPLSPHSHTFHPYYWTLHRPLPPPDPGKQAHSHPPPLSFDKDLHLRHIQLHPPHQTFHHTQPTTTSERQPWAIDPPSLRTLLHQLLLQQPRSLSLHNLVLPCEQPFDPNLPTERHPTEVRRLSIALRRVYPQLYKHSYSITHTSSHHGQHFAHLHYSITRNSPYRTQALPKPSTLLLPKDTLHSTAGLRSPHQGTLLQQLEAIRTQRIQQQHDRNRHNTPS